MQEFNKIYGPFKRHVDGPDRNKLIIGQWARPEFEVCQHLRWHWTEKIDGTNIRVHWDGHKVTFGGRTANAQLPASLLGRLQSLFTEEIMEQVFQDTEVTLYGEGFGPRIQKAGHLYGDEQDFILFDVKIGKWWLLTADMIGVAEKLGCRAVPYLGAFTVEQAIDIVGQGYYSKFGTFIAEGMVGRVAGGLLTRSGERIMMKVKSADFYVSTDEH